MNHALLSEPLSLSENKDASISREAPNKAHIQYSPTVQEQEAASQQGIMGQFVVQYDVARAQDGGEIQVWVKSQGH